MVRNLKVTSHVARDLLQSADIFQHERLVVWEYVSNGLQYIDAGIRPEVHVTISNANKKIIVSDNGRGMDFPDLENFFVMHGENLDRKFGRKGRGYFGTGKSAAFGIANKMKITTVQDYKRSVVELKRSDIEIMTDSSPVPVKIIDLEQPCGEKNGTIVEIAEIKLRKMDVKSVKRYIEKHVSHWPDATVYVNREPCEIDEPPIAKQYKFEVEGSQYPYLPSKSTLTVKVSKRPLDKEEQGVAILSDGIWHETTLAGNEGKDMTQFIFGEFDVPDLDCGSGIPAFDLSRSMRLNQKNPVVQEIYAFVGRAIETVRTAIVREEKERKKREELRKLSREAQKIADVLNKDFHAFRDRFQQMRSKLSGGRDLASRLAKEGEGPQEIVQGNEIGANELGVLGNPLNAGKANDNAKRSESALQLEEQPEASAKGKRATTKSEESARRGGFNVEFLAMGESEARAKYERSERTIYINLDHPQVDAVHKSLGLDNPSFRRLAYEIAFSEYAIAIAYELDGIEWYLETSEPIADIRETINRVTRAAARMYSDPE